MNTASEYKIENVELEITNICKHRCPYCYVGDVTHEEDMCCSDYNTICKIIDKLNEYGTKVIALLGGDPVQHPKIMDIIHYIKENTPISVSIMSNTLDFGDISPEKVAKCIDNIDFTLHGRNAVEHESFCGGSSGLYDDIMSKLRRYIASGVNVNIAINVIPSNYNLIYEMVESVISNDVKFTTLLLQRILPLGRAKDSTSYDLNADQIKVALEQIACAETDFGIEISFEDPFPLCYVPSEYHKYMKGCPEGINRIPIRGNGLISSCGAVGDTVCGNILTDSYEEIWIKNQRFCEFRMGSFLTNERCANCEYKKECRGGCPVRYMISEKNGEPFWKKFEYNGI